MFGSDLLRKLAFGFGAVLFTGVLTLSARSSGGQEDPKEGYYVISNTVDGSNRRIYIPLDSLHLHSTVGTLAKTAAWSLFERYPEPNNIDVSPKANLEILWEGLVANPTKRQKLFLTSRTRKVGTGRAGAP